MVVKVKMPKQPDARWRSWCKVLKGVDITKSNGYAFDGDFLPCSNRRAAVYKELPVGALILHYAEEGSRKYHLPVVRLYRVEVDGSLTLLYEKYCQSWQWAIEVKEDVARIFEDEKVRNLSAQARLSELLARKEKLLKELGEIETEIQKLMEVGYKT